jgi:hypothetical protein
VFTDPDVKAVVAGGVEDVATRLGSERVRSIMLL